MCTERNSFSLLSEKSYLLHCCDLQDSFRLICSWFLTWMKVIFLGILVQPGEMPSKTIRFFLLLEINVFGEGRWNRGVDEFTALLVIKMAAV